MKHREVHTAKWEEERIENERERERERSGVKETRDKRLLRKRRRKFEIRRKAYRQKKDGGINQSQGASPFVSSQ